MFIGASPGSCGGGIKTTTAGVVFTMLVARFHNREDVNIARRRIPNDIVSKAISVTFFSMVIILFFTILLVELEGAGISHQESRGLFLEYLFEVVSAFGTVGLSSGLTSELSVIGKFIISLTMFVGRLGPLTIAMAISETEKPRFKYAQEKLLIG
jgi:trk system potassium uptake protein TrkH